MGYSKRKESVPDVTLQKETENHKFTFISEINAWNTYWNISKLTILCSEKPFSKKSYYTETSQVISNAKQLAGCQTIQIFSERYLHALTHFQPRFHLNKPGCWFLLAKCLKKQLWKSDILSKDAGHWPVSLIKMSL